MFYKVFFMVHFFFYILIAVEGELTEETGYPSLVAVADTNSLFVPDAPEEPKKIRISLDEMRVLIVEDDGIFFSKLESFCKRIGIKNIEGAKNGAIGVQKFSEDKPHLIFMDRNMPVMDGIYATREIRTLQSVGAEPVIICISDDRSERNGEEFKGAGANDFFFKPGDLINLPDVLDRYFDVTFKRDFSPKKRRLA